LTSYAKSGNVQLRFKDFIKFILFLFIAVLLVALAFRGISIRTILARIYEAKFIWVFFSFLLSAVALVSRAYRWSLLLEPLGYKPPLQKTFYALMTGYLANLAFPRLGEVTRCGSLSKAESIPFNVLLGTVIIERIVDVLSLLICILITTIIEFKRLGHFLRSGILEPILNKLRTILSSPIGLIGLVLLIALAFLTIRYLNKKKNKKEGGNRIANLIKGIIDGIDSIRKLEKPWAFVFHSIFIWVLYYFGVYVALFALPSTSSLGFGAALFLLVAGGIGMSAPVQGGIGAYHLLVSQGLILYGLTQQDGLTFATLLHGLQIVLIVLFGSISVLFLFLGRDRKKIQESKTLPEQDLSH
jgi:glycosyltransferase 2 family protein